MKKGCIEDRLAASIRFDAVNGDVQERSVCKSQMAEAVTEITRLRKMVFERVGGGEMGEKEKREIVYWSCDEGKERLIHESLDAAVEAYLDELDAATFVKMIGTTIHVWGFARMRPTPSDYISVALEPLLECLDEKYGDPYGSDYLGETDAIQAAALEFCEKVLSEYVPWACEEATVQEVVVGHWVRKNNPQWLKAIEDL